MYTTDDDEGRTEKSHNSLDRPSPNGCTLNTNATTRSLHRARNGHSFIRVCRGSVFGFTTTAAAAHQQWMGGEFTRRVSAPASSRVECKTNLQHSSEPILLGYHHDFLPNHQEQKTHKKRLSTSSIGQGMKSGSS